MIQFLCGLGSFCLLISLLGHLGLILGLPGDTNPERLSFLISASFATFEPCKSHAVHRKVGNSGWPISSPWVGRTVTPEGIFRPVATAQEDSHVYAI